MVTATHDLELLAEFVQHGSQDAFTELVRAHIGSVYSTCFRQLRDRQLAEDATQATFMILAKKARSLPRATLLPLWLHKTARYVCLNLLRGESARKRREQAIAALRPETTVADASERAATEELAPLLDEGMHRLNDGERSALLLRYFHGASLQEMGQALGISADAALMRIRRGIEKLRAFFARRGHAVTSSAVGAALMAPLLIAKPSAALLTATVTSALSAGAGAAGAGAAATSSSSSAASLSQGALKLMAATKLKVAAITCIGVAAVGAGGAVLVAQATRPHGTTRIVVPAAPANTQPAAAAAVSAHVAKYTDDLRRTLIRFDLTSTHQSDQPLTPPDDARIAAFPNGAWPDVSGYVTKSAASYRKVGAATPYRKDAGQVGYIFDSQLVDQLAGGSFQTLVFSKGVASEGVLGVDSYNTIFSPGSFAGTLNAANYATLIVEGDLSGKVVTNLWLNLVVTGRLSGSINVADGLTAYLMGGLDPAAVVTVGPHGALYIGGSTPTSGLSSIQGADGTVVHLEASDLPTGENAIGNLKVIVAAQPQQQPPPPPPPTPH